MSVERKREYIMEELKKRGYRITSQRRILIDIILENECGSCKEIYYRAANRDGGCGVDPPPEHVPDRMRAGSGGGVAPGVVV